VVVRREPRLFGPVGYCLCENRTEEEFEEALGDDEWLGSKVPQGLCQDAIDDCRSILSDIYGRMRNRVRANLLIGAVWEHIFVEALRELFESPAASIHHDCKVLVNGRLVRTENRWGALGDHPYVASIDGAQWPATPEIDADRKLCSCKVSARGFEKVDLAYCDDVRTQTGGHAIVWFAVADFDRKESIAFHQKLASLLERPITPEFSLQSAFEVGNFLIEHARGIG